MKDSGIVRKAQAAGPQGKTTPAGGGKTPIPKGDGLKTAWKYERGGTTDMSAAKKKVR